MNRNTEFAVPHLRHCGRSPEWLKGAKASCGTTLARCVGQEVTTMALDMTAQFMPMVWGMVVVMVVSGCSLLLSHE